MLKAAVERAFMASYVDYVHKYMYYNYYIMCACDVCGVQKNVYNFVCLGGIHVCVCVCTCVYVCVWGGGGVQGVILI